jgi:hypothetical protein
MKIPESIRIGGVEYAVLYTPDLVVENQLCYGYICFDDSTIQILSNRDMGVQRQGVTLWHEILHGIREHSGMVIENEEEIVEMFSKGIYQVLQDNAHRLFDIVSDTDAP